MSGPRPIHSKPRKINDKPSPSEPSYSYEEKNLYLNDDFMSEAEHFHSKRGEYYSYTPHSSNNGAAAAKSRSSSIVGGDSQSASHPTSPSAKDSQTRKLQFSETRDSTLSPSDRRKFRSSHSFNEIVNVDDSGIHGSLPRSPKSYPSFAPPLCGSKAKDERLTSTTSCHTDDVAAADATMKQLDIGSDNVLRLPKAPDFVWKKNPSFGETPKVTILENLPLPADTVKPKHQYARKDSSTSLGRRDAKREAKKRAKARMYKHGASEGSFEYGHLDNIGGTFEDSSIGMLSTGTSQGELSEDSFSTLQGKRLDTVKERLFYTINSDKKKLTLRDLNLTSREVPVDAICSYPLGSDLLKLCLAGNQLSYLSPKLVLDLAGLRTLDLKQCGLCALPEQWNLPNLRKLDVGHNRLKSFLPQGAIEGLPRLEHLDMNNNEIREWAIAGEGLLSQLESLNLDYNEISDVPAELTQLQRLRFLRISNNQISFIPREAVFMSPLQDFLVVPNPLIKPPSEECEQGIAGMKRYYVGLERAQNFKASAARRRLFRKQEREKRRSKKALSKAPPASSSESPGEVQDGTVLVETSMDPIAVKADRDSFASGASAETYGPEREEQEVNDTLKVIVVGMGSIGKTTVIKRLKHGPTVEIPKREERTIGVDINEWDPMSDSGAHGSDAFPCNTEIVQEGTTNEAKANIKFSVWDFAGQDVYHATHEIFFSPNALYVLVWDMAAHNQKCIRRPKVADIDDGWHDSSDEEYDEIYSERELFRADRALDMDIDEKVQYWINCIQSRVPGAVILPVASFDDQFDSIEKGGPDEAQRRVIKMKERILHHEKIRVEGLNERLQALKSSHRADSQEAARIRELLSHFHRPKIIFGEEGSADIVQRVSGLDSRGFEGLKGKIINIATGRELPSGMSYPLFRGHVGSPIPPIRKQIREFVREKKAEKKYQVLELRSFLSMLTDYLGFEADHGQIGDALRFLHRIGELSFFGDPQEHPKASPMDSNKTGDSTIDDESDRDPDTSIEHDFSGLGLFVFLETRWLAAILGCILRHDLKQQIEETRYDIERSIQPSSRWHAVGRGENFHDANKNCPIITAAEAVMLWRARKKIRKAAERASINGSDSVACPFTFMQGLLVHFSVFVPIDLGIKKAMLGGEDFSTPTNDEAQRFFFLPSQLNSWNAEDKIWTYKSNDSWKTCIATSWLFPDSSPPGLFEHVTASVLRDLYGAISDDESKESFVVIPDTSEQIGRLHFREILCWKTAFNVVLGKSFVAEDGNLMESRVEIWVQLVDQESQYCVAGESTTVGMRRLVVSGKGPDGNGCRKIWDGGYGLVLKAIERVIGEYGGLEYSKQGVCPHCLATRDLRRAKVWSWTCIQDAARKGPGTITCGNGHKVDVRHVGGRLQLPRTLSEDPDQVANSKVPFSDLCGGVVLVGLWDGAENRVVAAGSGFVVDSKRGLIVTAGHILITMDNGASFGADYCGLQHGRAVIGIVPANKRPTRMKTGPQAFFRYFAEIVAKSPRNMDACVLRINAKIRKDIGGDGSDCGRYLSDPILQSEKCSVDDLKKLRPTKRCEYEEAVRIIGFNQGGEALVKSPRLNRVIEVVNGNIVKIHDARELYHKHQTDQSCFKPLMEIVVGNCPTIGGQSGGPCVNQSGKVIGILSRSDPEDKSRCYLVPAEAFMELVNVAKSWDDYQGYCT